MTKIILPDDLRTEVVEFLPWVRKKIKEAQTKENSATLELGKLKAQSADVSAEIEKLKPLALSSSAKAAAMTTAEKRLTLFAERIETIEKEILERQQVRMHGLNDLMHRIGRHWLKNLPDVMANALAPFCRDKAMLRAASAMCDCFSAAHIIRDRQSNDPSPIATERMIEQTEVLFARVLRGQPHLLYDCPEDAEATTEVSN